MKFFSLSIILLICTAVWAQTIPALPGHPAIINFTAENYSASTQNWSVAQQAMLGNIVVANSSGVLFYNGSRWNLQPMPGRPIVRCVAAAADGKVYAGAYGKAGYWDFRKAEGVTRYVSLDTLIFKKGVAKEEIWKIIPTQEYVLFQTFNRIFLLYPDGQVQQLTLPKHFIFADEVNGRIFIPVPKLGLYELLNRRLVPVDSSHQMADLRIRRMMSYQGKNILLVAEKEGVWVYSLSGSLKKLDGNGGSWLAAHSISFGLPLKNGNYLFGSSDGGAIVTDDTGAMLEHFDITTGLQSNTIVEGMEDRDGNIWLVGDKGIDLIVMNSPFRMYTTHTKFMDAAVWKGNIYFATNYGLLFQRYSDWKEGKAPFFNVMPGIKEFVWNTAVFADQLLVGSASGTFLVKENGSVKRISAISGGWTLQRLKRDTNYLVQGNFNGLALFKKDAGGEWCFFKQLQKQVHPVKELAQDSAGDIYFKHAYEGIYRCRLNADLNIDSIATPQNSSSYNITPKNSLFEFNGKVYITSENGFLKWEKENNNIEQAPEAGTQLGGILKSRKIIPGSKNEYWAVQSNRSDRFVYINRNNDGEIKNMQNFFIHNFALNYDYEKIRLLDKNQYLFIGGNMLALFSMQNPVKDNYLSYKPYFSQLLFRDADKLIEQQISSDSTITLPNKSNYFLLRYTFPVFDRDIRYRYRLSGNGIQDNWSEWVGTGEREFLNMSPGNYQFTVQTDLVPGTISIKIIVLPPWYWSTWAKCIYVLMFCMAIYGLLRWHAARLKAKQQRVMQKMTAEIRIRQQAMEKEQEMIERDQEKLKKEQLELNLNAKAREAADSAMGLIKKNEFLQKIRKDLVKIKDSENRNLAVSQSDRLIRMIDNNMKDEQDEWMLFESNFNQVHEQFYKKMLESYPGLTPGDLKFAAYLKMNLSSKEIAPLLSITVKSLDLKRHRLRKKMNLAADQNLNEVLMKF